ncbi:hypothetical protein L1856_23475 [Streptomyces sp. Tue 6430]|nr:hypothetical protein [Streptomyces sp. Tue 6430]
MSPKRRLCPEVGPRTGLGGRQAVRADQRAGLLDQLAEAVAAAQSSTAPGAARKAPHQAGGRFEELKPRDDF